MSVSIGGVTVIPDVSTVAPSTSQDDFVFDEGAVHLYYHPDGLPRLYPYFAPSEVTEKPSKVTGCTVEEIINAGPPPGYPSQWYGTASSTPLYNDVGYNNLYAHYTGHMDPSYITVAPTLSASAQSHPSFHPGTGYAPYSELQPSLYTYPQPKSRPLIPPYSPYSYYPSYWSSAPPASASQISAPSKQSKTGKLKSWLKSGWHRVRRPSSGDASNLAMLAGAAGTTAAVVATCC